MLAWFLPQPANPEMLFILDVAHWPPSEWLAYAKFVEYDASKVKLDSYDGNWYTVVSHLIAPKMQYTMGCILIVVSQKKYIKHTYIDGYFVKCGLLKDEVFHPIGLLKEGLQC